MQLENEELINLLASSRFDEIDLTDYNVLKRLILLLEHDNSAVQQKSAKLLFQADLVPIEDIIKRYIASRHNYIKEQIIVHLDLFIPILGSMLTQQAYIDALRELLAEVSASKIYEAIDRAHKIAPQLSTLAEIAVRTCHSSFAEFDQSFIDYQIIANKQTEIKKILSTMLDHPEPKIVELTLRSVIKFPEFSSLVEKQLRLIVKQSSNPKHVQYAAIALMQTHNKRNADVMISRLEENKDPEEVQLTLIEALGNLGNSKAKGVLLEQFSKGEKYAYYAAQALSLFGEDIIPDLIKLLKNDAMVPHIIEVLKRYGDSVYRYLLESLEHSPPKIRKNVIQCFAFIMSEKQGYKGAIEHLTRQLSSKKEKIVRSIIDGLITLGTPTVAVLIEKLRSKDIQFRKNAIKVLEHFGYSNIEIALDDEFEKSEERVTKLGVLLYLYYPGDDVKELAKSFVLKNNKLRIKDEELFVIVKEALGDANPVVRQKACELLAYFGAKSVPSLIKSLSDHNLNIRRAAINSLRQIGSKRALIALIDAAKDKDPVIAETATRALGELGDPAVVETIIKNLGHSNDLIRDAAVYAIVTIGPSVIQRLTPLLSGGSKRVTEGIIQASIRIGPKALEQHLQYLEKGNETWFNNIKSITKGIGEQAEKVLTKYYIKTKKVKPKAQLEILLALIGRKPSLEELTKHLTSSKMSKYAIETINNLGSQIVPDLVTTLKDQPPAKIEKIIKETKKMNADIIYEMLNKIKEEPALCDFSKKIIKNNAKRLKMYCLENSIDYNNFVKECMQKK